MLVWPRHARFGTRPKKLAAGLDPSEERKIAKLVAKAAIKEPFAALPDEYLGKLRAEKKVSATLDKAEWLLGMAKTEFGTKPIRDITPGMVLQTLRKLEVKGDLDTAKQLRTKVGATFANESGLWNPDAIERALARIERNAIRRV
jgi:hypothetical protein